MRDHFAIREAARALSHPGLEASIAARDSGDASRLESIFQDTRFYPLASAEDERLGDYFFGGLATRSGELIPEAIHYNGMNYSQSLPIEYVRESENARIRTVKHPCMYAGILFNHFGHFVSECLTRLYAYEGLRGDDPFVVYHSAWGKPDYYQRNNWAGQIFAGFGIPLKRLLVPTHVTDFEEMLVPRQAYGFGFMHDPEPEFLAFIQSFVFPETLPQGYECCDRVYVSRSRLDRRAGGVVAESQFEQYMRSQGYCIFYPELHTLYEQLTVYSRAREIVFAEGSAILACILLPRLAARVAVVVRRRDPLRNIRVATDCFQGYGKDALYIDEVTGQYQFGAESWDALGLVDWPSVSRSLREASFVRDDFPQIAARQWDQCITEDLRAYLTERGIDARLAEGLKNQLEVVPRWTGPSHLVDPRTGSHVQPVTPII